MKKKKKPSKKAVKKSKAKAGAKARTKPIPRMPANWGKKWAENERKKEILAPPKKLLLAMLEEEVSRCTKCRLHETRTQTVFGRGSTRSGICFIGEAPGENEDEQGVPFVGKAGQLLDRIVDRMGLDRGDVYVMNVVKCRPPGNRAPEKDELEACRPFLEEQIDLVQPTVIALLGGTALHGVMGPGSGWISDVRGTWLDHRGFAVMPTYHPAYLLRTPGAKPKVWEDMKLVLERVGLSIPGKE